MAWVDGPSAPQLVTRSLHDLIWEGEFSRDTIQALSQGAETPDQIVARVSDVLRNGATGSAIRDKALRIALVAQHNDHPELEAMAWLVGLQYGVDPIRALKSLHACAKAAGDCVSAMECAGLLADSNPYSPFFREMLQEGWDLAAQSGELNETTAILLSAGPGFRQMGQHKLRKKCVQRALVPLRVNPALALRALINLHDLQLFPVGAILNMARSAGISPAVLNLTQRLMSFDAGDDPSELLTPDDAEWLSQNTYTASLLVLLQGESEAGQDPSHPAQADMYIFDLCNKLPKVAKAQRDVLFDLLMQHGNPTLLLEALFVAEPVLTENRLANLIALIRSVENGSVQRRLQALMQLVSRQTVLEPGEIMNAFDIDQNALETFPQAQSVSRMFARRGQFDVAYSVALQGLKLADGNVPSKVLAVEMALQAEDRTTARDMAGDLDIPNVPTSLRIGLARIAGQKGERELASELLKGLPTASGGQRLVQGHLEAMVNGDPRMLRDCAKHASPRPSGKKKTRVAVFDPGFGTVAGHHMAQTEFLYDFYQKQFGFSDREMAFLVSLEAANSSGDDPILNQLVPAFALDPYKLSHLCVDAPSLNNMNRAMERDLEDGEVFQLVKGAQIYQWHTTHAGLILGFAKWAAKHTPGSNPIFVLGMIVMDFLATHVPDDPFRTASLAAYKEAIEILQNIPGATVIAYTETNVVRDAVHQMMGDKVEIHVLPYLAAALAGDPEDHPEPFSRDKMHFGLVGGNRAERGLDLFAPLIEQFETRDDITWTLQMSRSFAEQTVPDHISILERAQNKGILRWLSEPRLDQETYYEAFSGLDCVVMPYRERYASSGSGVFYEALQLGKFLIVPHNTFMRKALNETTYPHKAASGVDVASFAEAIQSVLDEKDSHKEAIGAFRASGHQMLPVGKFAELLQTALENRPEPRQPGVWQAFGALGLRIFGGAGRS